MYKPLRILHFEDDDAIARIYKNKCQEEGIEYIHYTNPTKDPVSVVVRERPDMILMDIAMPEMDGFAAAELIKGDERTKKYLVFGLSNIGDPKHVQEHMSYNMDLYRDSTRNTPEQVIQQIIELVKENRKKELMDYLIPILMNKVFWGAVYLVGGGAITWLVIKLVERIP